MDIIYQAIFKYDKKNKLSLTRILPDGDRDTSPVNLADIHRIEKKCRDFRWNKSTDLSCKIGKELYDLLNGDRQTLTRALKEAGDHGENLHLYVRPEGPISDLPFELLYQTDFLVPSDIHLVRRVSDWGHKRSLQPEKRSLRVLFIACSPEGLSPILQFEKEEDTIYKITKDLPVEIDVEDTGSLEGLGECLAQDVYDVVHLSGHADINNGKPFFWMEDEEGSPVQVTPSELWEKLNLNLPRLLFLSGCKTGQTPRHAAAVSFAHQLVANHSSTVLGWGLPVSDSGATLATKHIYFDLSRGEDILSAVLSARRKLFRYHREDWSLLRLFSDGTPLTIPLVERGQRRRPKPRDLQHTYLHNSQVKILKEGFVGRRKQIQRGLRYLKKDEEKIGLLLHGTGGLGKSCLAGKLCERLKDHTLIIVHGELNAVTFGEALKDGFVRGRDEQGLKILKETVELPDKIQRLCSSSFQERNYLILLDDFERNLSGVEEGKPEISPEAVDILEPLLRYLPYSGNMSQLIITSRYSFPLTLGGVNLVERNMESICLTSFRGADEWKKVNELNEIANYPEPAIRLQLIDAGRGNPRLMEALNTLLKEAKELDLKSLLVTVKDKQEEFVQDLILRKILESQPESFQMVMRHSAVFRLPVLKEGIKLVCKDIRNWEQHINQAVRLSLMEQGRTSKKEALYWVTPLISKGIFEELEKEDRKSCHQSSVSYYQRVLSEVSDYSPIIAIELIEHALKAGMDGDAIEEGGKVLPYLRHSLAYKEALSCGESILGQISQRKREEKFAKFLFELGWINYDLGDARKAIEYYEQALSIGKEVYGERHPSVARMLNNLGSAWSDIGETKKAIKYYEQALSIGKEVYGERHPDVAARLNNLGLAWNDLGKAKKAIEYYEQALSIDKEVYGGRHPDVATMLNNLGSAWSELGETKKAIKYYEQALSIDREVYGERHPTVATRLNNLGLGWNDLGETKKAIEYFEQALSIVSEVYGEKHPYVAGTINNLGGAWSDLGETKKAIEYFEQALSIDREVYGERHPTVATMLNNLGLAWNDLGETKKAIEYYEQALSIGKEVYGERHPTVATMLNNLGWAWSDLGETKKAIEYYEQALSIHKEVYGERHPDVATDLNNLGGAWSDLGDVRKAIEHLQRAYEIFREFYGDEHPHTKNAKAWLDSLKNTGE